MILVHPTAIERAPLRSLDEWANRYGHVLVCAFTRSGKNVLMLEPRRNVTPLRGEKR